MRILIVEDEPAITRALEQELQSWGYETASIEDWSDVIGAFRAFQPQLVLLDIVLPQYNGFYWCQAIRRESQVPIIFISSKSDQMDIVMAIQMGGDEFITKPLNLTVTSAKIAALLRRSYAYGGERQVLSFGSVTLHPDEAMLRVGAEQQALTATEVSIMERLFRAQGAYVSREALMEHAWEKDAFIDDNTLAVNISRLRRKLADCGLEHFIVTKKGMGYALSDS